MAAATKRQPPAQAGSGERAAAVDPKFEWAEKAGGYVLRLALPGFRKDQFRVQVDGAGRLTVRGARPGTGTAAGQSSFSKVFQLPSSASLDDITGRFEAGVLTLTVPMSASSSAGAGAAPTSIEELKRKQPGATKDTKPKEEDVAKEDASKKKAMDEATNKAHQQPKQEEEASKSKQEQQKPDPSPAVKKESQELKPKAPQAAPASPPEKPAPAPVKKEEEMKPKVPQATAASPPEKPAPTPDAATGANKPKAVVAPESLAERVRRRGEEEGANAATIAPAKRAKTDGENKATAACVGWKERVQGELKVLTDMKWADGMVEAAKKNKEVVALGIAAFSLGLVVSHRLFFRK